MMMALGWMPVQLLVRLSFLGLLWTVLVPDSSTAKDYTGSHVICRTKCGSYGDERTYKACMLHCRNYIEGAMSRPRLKVKPTPIVKDISDEDELESFETDDDRVGSERVVAKRPGVRGSFVRIGRQNTETAAGDEETNQNYRAADADPTSFEFDKDDLNSVDGDAAGSDVTKRKYGFVRIGRQKPEQFVRIGKETSAENERDKKAAFVRIGRKPANFVRIGRGRKSGFVRIGKASSGSDETNETADDCKQDGGDGSCVEKRRRQAFVRIGK